MTAPVTVWVPSHITGLFSVHRDEDPAQAGSRGAGLTLTDGITVTVREASNTRLEVAGEALEIPAVSWLLDQFDRPMAVTVETTVPLGSGFGVSGAVALGTALGANSVCSAGHSENELIRLAHVADVRAGTGLGDVVAQHRGGAPLRLEPGPPGIGHLDGIPERAIVEYLPLGALATEEVIAGDVTSINTAGERALTALLNQPTLDQFVSASYQFANESGLLSSDVRAVIEAVQAIGSEASMGMLGRTVFCVGSGLSDAGYDPERCEIATGGVRIGSADGEI